MRYEGHPPSSDFPVGILKCLLCSRFWRIMEGEQKFVIHRESRVVCLTAWARAGLPLVNHNGNPGVVL